jgi:hypothetical protein
VDGDIGAVPVANRPALQSDYYTGKKITVTPLNFVCKRRRRQRYWASTAFAVIARTAHLLRSRRFLRRFPENAKNVDETATSLISRKISRSRLTGAPAIDFAPRIDAEGDTGSQKPPAKKLCTDGRINHVDRASAGQNARIGAQPIRKTGAYAAPSQHVIPGPSEARKPESILMCTADMDFGIAVARRSGTTKNVENFVRTGLK